MDKALPGRTVDLIRDGVGRADLRAGGDKAVYVAVRRAAISAQLRDWKQVEWEALLDDRRSALGRQARSQRGKPRTGTSLVAFYGSAWSSAAKYVAGLHDQPHVVRETARREAVALATDVRAWLAEADVPLNDLDRDVLDVICGQAVRHGSMSPVAPFARLLDAIPNTNRRQLRYALDRLTDAGLRRCVERGRPGAATGRAGRYRLPGTEARAAFKYRETRSVSQQGQDAQVCVTPVPGEVVTLPQVCVTPDGGGDVLTLTLSANSPDALAAALAAITNAGLAVEAIPAPGPSAKVLPLHRREATTTERKTP